MLCNEMVSGGSYSIVILFLLFINYDEAHSNNGCCAAEKINYLRCVQSEGYLS